MFKLIIIKFSKMQTMEKKVNKNGYFIGLNEFIFLKMAGKSPK